MVAHLFNSIYIVYHWPNSGTLGRISIRPGYSFCMGIDDSYMWDILSLYMPYIQKNRIEKQNDDGYMDALVCSN